MELTPDQLTTLRDLAKVFATGGLIGAGGRAAVGVVNSLSPRYEPPPPPKPLVVDVPVPHAEAATAPEPAAPGLAPRRKAAADGLSDPINKFLGMFSSAAPKFQSPAEADNLYYMAAPAAGLAGLGGGWALTNKLLQAARRRGAEANLQRARRDYQEAALGRISELGMPTKQAADWRAAAAGDEPTDPDVARAAAALDGLWEQAKSAEVAGEPNYLARTLLGMAAPGFVSGSPALAHLNAGAIGVSGLAGGLLGWRALRDRAKATELQRQIREVEDENAQEQPPPMIARLVPTGPAGRPLAKI